jgi:hypothetical protein
VNQFIRTKADEVLLSVQVGGTISGSEGKVTWKLEGYDNGRHASSTTRGNVTFNCIEAVTGYHYPDWDLAGDYHPRLIDLKVPAEDRERASLASFRYS